MKQRAQTSVERERAQLFRDGAIASHAVLAGGVVDVAQGATYFEQDRRGARVDGVRLQLFDQRVERVRAREYWFEVGDEDSAVDQRRDELPRLFDGYSRADQCCCQLGERSARAGSLERSDECLALLDGNEVKTA